MACKTCQIKNINNFVESEVKKIEKRGVTMLQTFDEFVRERLGTFIDYDGVFGNQCVDLTKDYVENVLGVPAWKSDAEDYQETYPREKFYWIYNTIGALPEKGDIMVFNDEIGEFGHVCIAIGEAGDKHFKSIDQNWPKGSPVQIVKHDYNGVIGWLRVKSQPVGTPIISPPSPENAPNGETGADNSEPRIYRVQRGDSLWRIAKKFYGAGSHWPRIFAANRDKIEKPELIYPGSRIKIPE